MSTSKIRIRKVCAWCGNEFEAQKVTTQYCSKRCAEHAYKNRKRHEEKSSFESNQEKEQEKASCSKLEGREFLSVAEVAQLLHVTSRAIYYLIERGVLPASQLSNRWTIVRRADIDAMLVARPYERKPKTTESVSDDNGEAVTEFYTTKEIIEKFGVSNSWVFAQGKAHNIPKVYHRGKTLWSKVHCDRVFTAKPEPPKENDWISYSEVRAEYNLTHDQLHNYVKYHGLRRKKVGKYTYVLRSEIDAILRPPTR